MAGLAALTARLQRLWPMLDERTRRLTAANEARAWGRGGIGVVSQACGLSRRVIGLGLKELAEGQLLPPGRVRRAGGGRKRLTTTDPAVVRALEAVVADDTRGDPQSPLRWTCKSTRAVARALTVRRHPVSHTTVGQLLHDLGYSLQSNRKMEEGRDHPDRDAQFRHINAAVKRGLASGNPVISVDTKKKELLGNFENPGQQWRPAKRPRGVQTHDFPSPDVPRAYPYGIYDIGRNTGFVNLGTDHDTGAFAVASIRGWWHHEGRRLYPHATQILITADAGGSNGWRLRLWKLELQRLADDTHLAIAVCHFPPGTSKWNKVEHRLFSFISSNWRGEPLRDYETVVKLIARTTTAKGLTVTCRLDRRKYATGRTVTPAEMQQVNLHPQRFHGEWNYVIRPRPKTTP
jgi:Rhodopirellula transposase DDE domain